MTNDLNLSIAEYWSRRQQMKHDKTDVFRAFANFEEEATLKNGDTVHRPYRSAVVVQNYTRGTAVTVQDISTTDEYLVVQTAKVAPFYIDDLDALQSNYNEQNKWADDTAVKLGNEIDGDVLGEVANAKNSVDDAVVSGGTAGDGITVTTSNIQKVFSKAKLKLNRENIGQADRFAVISPDFEATLTDYLAGKETQLGDSTGLNGHIGKFYGFDLYVSNAVYYTARLEFGTNPSDTNTVVINGVTFTFRTTQGAAAGSVNICSDAAHSCANLVASINAPGTTVTESTDAGFNALSAADQILLHGVTATNGTTYLTLAVKGAGYMVVAETLTNASDIWTHNLQIQHLLFGQKKCVDVVIQSRPKLVIKEVADKLGKNFLPFTLYGKKTFVEGAAKMVDVKVCAYAY